MGEYILNYQNTYIPVQPTCGKTRKVVKIPAKYIHTLTQVASDYLKKYLSHNQLNSSNKSNDNNSVASKLQDITQNAYHQIGSGERYIVNPKARSPPNTQQAYENSIEQIIQEGEGEHIDNVVFRILKLDGVDGEYLQKRIQKSGYKEEKRILQRAVQIWERRRRLEPLVEKVWDWTKEVEEGIDYGPIVLDEMAEILSDYLLEDGYNPHPSVPPHGDPYTYGLARSLIAKYENKQKQKRVLDIGSGTGKLLHTLWHFGYEGVGLELGNRWLDTLSRNRAIQEQMDLWKSKGFRIMTGDIYSLPTELREERFPITVSTRVLDVLLYPTDNEWRHLADRPFFEAVATLTAIDGISVHVSHDMERIRDSDFEADGLFEILQRYDGVPYCYVVLKRTKKKALISRNCNNVN